MEEDIRKHHAELSFVFSNFFGIENWYNSEVVFPYVHLYSSKLFHLTVLYYRNYFYTRDKFIEKVLSFGLY